MLHQINARIEFFRLRRVSLMHDHSHVRYYAQKVPPVLFIYGHGLVVARGKQDFRP